MGITAEPDLSKLVIRTYERLLPRLQRRLSDQAAQLPPVWKNFLTRLEHHFETMFALLFRLYGVHFVLFKVNTQYDFFYYLEELLVCMGRPSQDCPTSLKQLDEQRPLWFQSHQMVGGVCYVDLFAGDVQGIRDKIPYF